MNYRGRVRQFIAFFAALTVLWGCLCFSNTAVQAENDLVIILDAGHGGHDPGADKSGHYEKTLNLNIANAIKTALDKYEGVKVYMTRISDDTYLSFGARTSLISYWGADLFISVHNNSADSASATGSEIYVPNGEYRPELKRQAEDVGNNILANFTAQVGLRNRGCKTRSYADDDTVKYPNGNPSDYYGVIRRSVLSNIPGMIIECGFMTNADDIRKLSDPDTVAKIGEAAAQGIAKSYQLKLRTSGEAGAYGQTKLQSAIEFTLPNKTFQFGDTVNFQASGGSGGGEYFFEGDNLRLILFHEDGSATMTGVGTVSITASKNCDETYYPNSSRPVKITITPRSAGMQLYVAEEAGAPSTTNRVYCIAENLGAGQLPAGTVTFYNGDTVLGTGTFQEDGRCSVLLENTVVGNSYQLRAAYTAVENDCYTISEVSRVFEKTAATQPPVPTPTPSGTAAGDQTENPGTTGAPATEQPGASDTKDIKKILEYAIMITIILLLIVIIVILILRGRNGKKRRW